MASNSTVTISFRIDDQGKGFKALTMDADSLRRVMQSNIEVADRLDNRLVNFAAVTASIKGVTDAVSTVTDEFRTLTADSNSFFNAMRQANTLADKDDAGFARMKEQVSDLSKEIPILRDKLANGLYQTISNGVPEDNWMSFLEASAKSAVGGLADIEQVVGVTSTVVKNYGLSWEEAGAIQDKIQLAAKNGVTTFGQLAAALPRVTGNAATLGVSIDELMGTFATLTGVSGNTAEVSTQLAAIFTALVKPSSEAAQMADQMGIKFDAAAIKSAGGLQQFLQMLDRSVKSYAESSGMLEQEVCAKLFGSAESLRALIPLQGELSDKFGENVAKMRDSAGTMDAAYDKMAGSADSFSQRLRNLSAAMMDSASEFIAPVMPLMEFSNNTIRTAGSIAVLVKAVRNITTSNRSFVISAKQVIAWGNSMGVSWRSLTGVMKFLGFSLRNGSFAARTFTLALRGIMSATGIGLVIWGIGEAIGFFVDQADEATDVTKDLDDGTDAYTQAAADAKVSIDKEISSLKALIDSGADATAAVRHLNEAYGESFGTYRTASEWYKTLTENSEAYVRQIGYEAQARQLASKIAEASVNREMAALKRGEWEKANSDKMVSLGRDRVTGLTSRTSRNEEWVRLKKEEEEYARQVDDLNKRLDIVNKKSSGISDSLRKGKKTEIATPKESEPKNRQPRQSTAPVFREDASNLKEYEENIRALQSMLETASIDEAARINALIRLYQEKADAVRKAGEAATQTQGYDAEASTLEGFRANIRALEAEKSKASFERIKEINIEIANWQRLADLYDSAGVAVRETTAAYDENASTIKAMRDNISILQEQLQTATITEAVALNSSIELWERKIRAIEDAGKASESTFGMLREGWSGVQGVGSGITQMTGALQGHKNAWETLSGVINGALQIYDGANMIIKIISQLVGASALQTAANETETASYSQLAAAKTFAAHASLPFTGTGIAAGMVATQQAMIAAAGVMKFADGGIAYGPTLGLFGEYAGASHNPEVVAPLDRLQDIIAPATAPIIIGGTLKASARDLVCVLSAETRIGSKTGRKSNIII